MSLPPQLAAGIAAHLGEPAREARRVAGGDINDAWSLELSGGRRAFLKTRADALAGEYATEAAGLRWLAEGGELGLPHVLGVGEDEGARFLALEWIEQGSLSAAGEERLGRGLAAVHLLGAPEYGAAPPGAPGEADRVPPLRIGSLRLANEPLATWPEFYAERRLRPLAACAEHRGSLGGGGRAAVEHVCERIEELAGPAEPPARLHGDLWSGNVMADARGRPYLVDPAAYGGHREVDLAMLALFGGAAARVLDAYREAHPLAEGHEQRTELWQLFPLLVHAVLFGGSYGASVERAAHRCAGGR